MADRTLTGDQRRGLLFGVFALACLLAGSGYVAFAAVRSTAPAAPRDREPQTARSPLETASSVEPELARLRAAPHIYYRSTREGERGRIVVASLAAPDSQRWVSDLSCDRAHFGRRRGVCVRSVAGSLGSKVSVELLGADLKPLQQFELDGVPSRARLSPDERFAAITLFVTGDDYEADFSTRTKIFELDERRMLPDIEFFDVERDGQPFQRIDFNYWGVTFREDSRLAYATLRTENTTHLVKIDVEAHNVLTLRENVECPSLSPSGARLAYKKRVGAAGSWRLHVLELDSLREHALSAERRSVDDQVEWLDDGHVLYAPPAVSGKPQRGTSLWLSPVEASSTEPARSFIEGAASPAVVR